MTRSIEQLTRIQHLWADAGYPSADALADALKHIFAYHEALTPSGATKAAYIGEFKFTIEEDDPREGEDYREREITVPWTTTKEIMEAIRNRASERAKK